jgi:hypothetical protein
VDNKKPLTQTLKCGLKPAEIFMENNNTNNLFQRYRNLPDDLKEALWSVDSYESLQAIGRQLNLHVDQLGIVADATGRVILGLDRPDDFGRNLSGRLTDLSPAAINQIVSEVNRRIFARIRESLKQAHELHESRASSDIEAKKPSIEFKGSGSQETAIDLSAGAGKTAEELFQKRLSGLFRVPPGETSSGDEGGRSQSENSVPGGWPTKPKPDPYRESVE